MDIGTAKPTLQEQVEVRHHLLDVVEPNEPFSVAQFKALALQAIDDIAARGKVPIMVGGTGLYIDAVLYDFSFRDAPNPDLRAELANLSVAELQQRLVEMGLPLPHNAKNPRHLIRAIETNGIAPHREPLRTHTFVTGLVVPREVLAERIRTRTAAMIAHGFEGEVRALVAKYGWDSPGLQAPGYKAFREYIAGTISLAEAADVFARNDLQLAKRQKTWFQRNESIHWYADPNKLVEDATTFLNKSA